MTRTISDSPAHLPHQTRDLVQKDVVRQFQSKDSINRNVFTRIPLQRPWTRTFGDGGGESIMYRRPVLRCFDHLLSTLGSF